MKNKIILVGSGYLGGYIINSLLEKNTSCQIFELSRTKKNRPALIKTISMDLDNNPLKLQAFAEGIIIYMAPPSIVSLQDCRVKNFLKNLEEVKAKRFIYISTSGVYGDCNGERIDEARKVNPDTDRAKRRVSAETQITKYCKQKNISLIILRVPGIYGKGRLPIDKIKSGEPIIKKEDSKITNLIHVEDLARVVIAAVMSKNLSKHEIINISDGSPTSSTDYYEITGMLLGIKITNYITYTEAENIYTKKRLSFLRESRVLNVDKMFKLFPGCIKYTSLEDGIRASL